MGGWTYIFNEEVVVVDQNSVAEHKSGHGEQYRSRMKKRVGQMGWSVLSEEEKLARETPTAVCGRHMAVQEAGSTVRTTVELMKIYFRTFSVAD